ncbi:CRISPR-associated endonuclease Cas1 [Streptomyces sp. NPDC059080]|uniref:CRISPR-associated endonuclease Cas4g/Cas1g n=1 Tax=Streptomyces sp. NPDC059080 TaxID=3346718 RepID=UPI0036984668
MLNEAAYCPRLFYLEWAQAQFRHNADTAAGKSTHRHVDSGGGSLPEPDGETPRVARSVSLSSEELGLTAVIDLVEPTADGQVRPVDYKKGSAPDLPEGAYEPERVQVCAQGLLLQHAGYTCESGILYFAGSRTRVEVLFDERLIARTYELIAQARMVAAADQPPPPLLDSPKCPRCSLVTICLPDEINTLRAHQQRRPRRLIPRDDAAHPLYVTTQGAWIGVSGGRISVSKNKEQLSSTRLLDISQICLFGNVQISSQALRTAFREEIPVCFFSYGGWFSGLAEGLPGKNVQLRRQQVLASVRGDTSVAAAMVDGKIRNCRTLLRRNARPEYGDLTPALDTLAALARQAAAATGADELLGIEGAAARVYFEHFTHMLRPDVRDTYAAVGPLERTRRPPLDPLNALLSYCYALLTKDVTAVCYSVGFDPYIGLYHRPRFGRPALALDLMEEFRPLLAESVVINVLNNGEVGAGDFLRRGVGVNLTESGRKAVLRAYERRLNSEVKHPMFGYTVSYRRVLEVQVRLLAAHLLGEAPEYVPFRTR